MNETKEVLFFSMLHISRRALLYWKLTDLALCPSDENSMNMKKIVDFDAVLLTRKTELLDAKSFHRYRYHYKPYLDFPGPKHISVR
jgi:hypothetical protein